MNQKRWIGIEMRWIGLLLGMCAVLLCVHAVPVRVYGQTSHTLTVQLGPDTGRNVGLFSQRPVGWTADASNRVLVFGNYVGPVSLLTHQARTYLYFPFTLPTGATVQQATVRVYTFDWPFDGGAEMGVYAVDADWDEAMTWGGRPAAASVPLDSAVLSSTAGGWVQWAVTGLVDEWHRGTRPNYGMMLAGAPAPDTMVGDGWAAAAWGRMGAMGDLAPVLTIEYTAPAPVEIPEPGTWLLLAGGLTGLASWFRYKKNAGGRK